MNFKPFYVHQNTEDGTLKLDKGYVKRMPRAFTAFIQPGDNPRQVKVQYVFCSNKDEFVKKIGREEAHKKEVHVLNVRALPDFLTDISSELPWGRKNYAYILKYVV